MGLRKTKWQIKNFFPAISLIGGIFFGVFFFQNCTSTRLTKPIVQPSVSTPPPQISEYILSPPQAVTSELRVMFFVDQSRSMVAGQCPTDIDGEAPDIKGRGCKNPAIGSDPDKFRFRIIRQWLNQISTNPNAKVSIYPFSGGKQTRPYISKYVSGKTFTDKQTDTKFLPIETADPSTGSDQTARSRLAQLVEEHDIEKDKIPKYNPQKEFDNDPPDFMGTSIPYTQLTKARYVIEDEIKNLKTQGKLGNAWFRFIYISDFVLKPLPSLLKTAFNITGCPDECRTKDCSIRPDGQYYQGYALQIRLECMEIATELTQSWGNWDDNDPVKLLGYLRTFLGLPNRYGGGLLTMDFVQLNPDSVWPTNKEVTPGDTYPSFIYPAVKDSVAEAGFYQVTSGNPPFDIKSFGSENMSYKIDNLWIMNLNARVNSKGELAVDSDGDGLFDSEETDTNKQNPRSNGVCLDSITKSVGCVQASCDSHFDQDGDGLNQCEEKSLATAFDNKDTDDDGIPDILEAILGTHPLRRDQELDFNGDGFRNFVQAIAGVNPQASFASVPDNYRVSFTLNQLPPNSDGRLRYSFNLKNIPLLPTLESTGDIDLFKSDSKSPEDKFNGDQILGPTAHKAGVNQILVILKARALQNPNSKFWLYKKYEVDASNPQLDIKLDDLKPLHWVGN